MRVDPRVVGRRTLGAVRLLAVAYASAGLSLVFWANAPMLVGWQPDVVLTGSMSPVIRPGDVAGILPTDAREEPIALGRSVQVRDPSRASGSYLHRVVRFEPDGRLVTKGDANADEDFPAVDLDRVVGQLRLLVPTVGLPALWFRQGRWLPLAALVVCSWAALSTAVTVLRGTVGSDDVPEQADRVPA